MAGFGSEVIYFLKKYENSLSVENLNRRDTGKDLEKFINKIIQEI